MKRTERSLSQAEAPTRGRRALAAVLLGTLAVTGCAAKGTPAMAPNTPQLAATQEAPVAAPTISETQRVAPPIDPELPKKVDHGLETVVRRMQHTAGFETGKTEDGRMWVSTQVAAPVGNELTALTGPGHTSGYMLYVESSVADAVLPDKAVIGAYYDLEPGSKPGISSGGAAFEITIQSDPTESYLLTARSDGPAPWALEGLDAERHADELLAMAADVADGAIETSPIDPYAQP